MACTPSCCIMADVVKLAELKRKERTIIVPWQLDDSGREVVEIEVTYDPSSRTMENADPSDPNMSLKDFWVEKLVQAVKRWDITDDHGTPLPITKEGIGPLEDALVQTILAKIQDDARPNLKSMIAT
jgi:hypothetical protein